MSDQEQRTDGESRREQSRTCFQTLSEFLAVSWLVVVWSITPTAIVFWDSGPVQDLLWVLFIGFIIGPIPLIIVRKLVIPREINPPPKLEPEPRVPTDWRQYGVLALVIMALILADKLAHPGTLVNSESLIPSSIVTLAGGLGSLVHLNKSKTLYDFSQYKNFDLASDGTLKTYLRDGDVIYKDAGYDEVTLQRAGRTSTWNIINF